MEAIHASSARKGPSLPENLEEILPKRVLMTEEVFCDWLASAEPSERVEYYRGLLLHDRMPSTNALQPRDRVALVALAKRAMQAAEDGRVLLVQRRRGEDDYSYIAIKARQRGRAYRTTAVRMDSRPCLNPATGPSGSRTGSSGAGRNGRLQSLFIANNGE